jgi:hypothetical protein
LKFNNFFEECAEKNKGFEEKVPTDASIAHLIK